METYKQKRKYLRIMIAVQLLVCTIMLFMISFLIHETSTLSNEFVRMTIVSDVKEQMEERINNTFTKIDLTRNDISKQTDELIAFTSSELSALKTSNFEKSVPEFFNNLAKMQIAKLIRITVINQYTREIVFNTGNISYPQNKIITKAQVDKLKSEAIRWQEGENGFYKFFLYAYQEDMDNTVKAQIYRDIHASSYQENEYIWVNEVLNFKGGENYAIRAIHPNLIATEGTYLSTLTQDAVGNYPYLKELDGINEKGELFQSYYFKNKSNGEIVEKFSYAKLYKPFNWIIATGKPIDEVFSFADKLQKHCNRTVNKTMFICLILTAIVFLLGLWAIVRLQKQYKASLDSRLKAKIELDPLSGAFSRKTADSFLDDQFKQFLCTNISPLLYKIDIDNFKKINLAYGSDVGSEVLCKIANTISSCATPQNQLFHWSEKEFLLLCTGIKEDEENSFAEKILYNINSITFSSGKNTFYVSVSIGSAYFKSDDTVYMDAINRADYALYKAKGSGKNRYFTDK